jgi:hypothetical protein
MLDANTYYEDLKSTTKTDKSKCLELNMAPLMYNIFSLENTLPTDLHLWIHEQDQLQLRKLRKLTQLRQLRKL